MSASAATPIDWKDVWDIAAHIGTVIGLISAGVWAYFNFIKSRTYFPRMEMIVSGEIQGSENRKYLVPRVTLKNIGQSKIPLFQSGSGYRIWITTENNGTVRELDWSEGATVFTMFEDHQWIEPGETVFDETRVFSLPTNCTAAKIQARLVASSGRFSRRKTNEWNCSAVILSDFTSSKGFMSNEDERLEKQQREQQERTRHWERDKVGHVNDQQPEDLRRTEEWNRNKKPVPDKK